MVHSSHYSGFDEPAFKATWDFTVTAPRNTTVISNGAIAEEILLDTDECDYVYSWGKSNKCKKVIFETTPIIASYVLTVFVGQYEGLSSTDSNGVLHSVWANLNEYEDGQFALDVAVKVLPYFEELLGYPYGIDKMDNIGVSSFPWGAMEAYGAVVYYKSGLLVDIDNDPREDIAYTAQLVGHEYAHMWYVLCYICIFMVQNIFFGRTIVFHKKPSTFAFNKNCD